VVDGSRLAVRATGSGGILITSILTTTFGRPTGSLMRHLLLRRHTVCVTPAPPAQARPLAAKAIFGGTKTALFNFRAPQGEDDHVMELCPNLCPPHIENGAQTYDSTPEQ
jgi:hypothetical protein